MELENFWKIKKKLTFTDICVEVRRLGDDYHILVSGGECPHIGCTVLAIPRPSLDGSRQDEQHGIGTERDGA